MTSFQSWLLIGGRRYKVLLQHENCDVKGYIDVFCLRSDDKHIVRFIGLNIFSNFYDSIKDFGVLSKKDFFIEKKHFFYKDYQKDFSSRKEVYKNDSLLLGKQGRG